MIGSVPPRRTTPPQGIEDEGDQRPTIVPSFDPEAFARDSETRQRAASTAGRVAPTMEEARRLHDRGDYEAALFMVTEVLQGTPQGAEASDLSARCRAALEGECLSAIGSAAAILLVAVTEAELKSFAIDNTAGFLLSFMDGATTVEDILDISGMPRLLALRNLRKLRERGIVKPLAEYRNASTRPPPLAPVRSPAPPEPDRQDDHDDHDDGPRIAPDSGVVPLRLAIPSPQAIPVLLVLREDLGSLALKPDEQLLLSLVNDSTSVFDIIKRAEMDVNEGMITFERLAEDGVVAFL
jgi:hypothetical protein